ncbi:hypothetical protein KSP40_PGU010757 [Platanthera guangdongensis]|uniref:Cell division control protein 24 OB domain-containing protein n=1 Tax=Platanthera guangdongensis TaxID=2320717 RepID=A0ABR2MPM1_9ASPA
MPVTYSLHKSPLDAMVKIARSRLLNTQAKTLKSLTICCVRLGLVELQHLRPVLSHSLCGHPVCGACDGIVQCSFCHLNCDSELIRYFHLEVTVADEGSNIFAWSTGQTASELLQISPDEFYELPEYSCFLIYPYVSPLRKVSSNRGCGGPRQPNHPSTAQSTKVNSVKLSPEVFPLNNLIHCDI